MGNGVLAEVSLAKLGHGRYLGLLRGHAGRRFAGGDQPSQSLRLQPSLLRCYIDPVATDRDPVIAPRLAVLQDVDPATFWRNLIAKARQVCVTEENVSVA